MQKFALFLSKKSYYIIKKPKNHSMNALFCASEGVFQNVSLRTIQRTAKTL